MKKVLLQNTGFTMIELLVVVGLGAVILVSALGLFFTSLVTNSKKSTISTVKDEGNYALSQMEFLVRNAVRLLPDPANPTALPCTTNMQNFTFKSLDGGTTTLSAVNGKIASKSAAVATPSYLTSDSVTLIGPTFTCKQTSSGFGTYVTITFTLQKSPGDYASSTAVQETFTTGVNIRSL